MNALAAPQIAQAPAHGRRRALWRAGALATALGALALLAAFAGLPLGGPWTALAASLGLLCLGPLALFWAQHAGTTPGIRHEGIMTSAWTARGAPAWLLGVLFTLFYVVLYFQEDLVGLGLPTLLAGGIRLVDPLAQLLAGTSADKWFLYGTLYTLAVLVMGARMLLKYRHVRYQRLRTLSVMFFQLWLAWLIPAFLRQLGQPEHYFSYFWPLKREYFFPASFQQLSQAGAVGFFMLFWSSAMAFVAVPLLTWRLGKRWYCSWVCGCGGLAETLGDPFRQNSDKSRRAWKVERWLIHSVLLLVAVTTALVWLNSWRGGGLLGGFSSALDRFYGLYIGAIFSGVIGVGFYPLMGNRVWCRLGCPLAAILGLLQRLWSRFRITTNGGQCISCGNCSTYCEMGIDVRGYAQRGENIVRSSCVGCGVCAAVCPRGVLNLENGPVDAQRYPGAARPLAALLEDPLLRRRA